MLSTFTPTQRFGALMLTILVAALVGDLVMNPALLAGPLGRFFEPRDRWARNDGQTLPPQVTSGDGRAVRAPHDGQRLAAESPAKQWRHDYSHGIASETNEID
jgi:hypothetical protein